MTILHHTIPYDITPRALPGIQPVTEFHRVPPLGGDSGHWCDPDQYDGSYDFSAWPAFTVTWSVRGPRKAYLMSSRYDPA